MLRATPISITQAHEWEIQSASVLVYLLLPSSRHIQLHLLHLTLVLLVTLGMNFTSYVWRIPVHPNANFFLFQFWETGKFSPISVR